MCVKHGQVRRAAAGRANGRGEAATAVVAHASTAAGGAGGGGQHASECRAVMRCSQGLVGCAFPLGCGGGEDCEYYRPTPSTKGGREGGGGRRRASSLMRSYAFPARSDHGELRRDRTRI